MSVGLTDLLSPSASLSHFRVYQPFQQIKVKKSREESQVITSPCNHSISMRAHRWPYGPCYLSSELFRPFQITPSLPKKWSSSGKCYVKCGNKYCNKFCNKCCNKCRHQCSEFCYFFYFPYQAEDVSREYELRAQAAKNDSDNFKKNIEEKMREELEEKKRSKLAAAEERKKVWIVSVFIFVCLMTMCFSVSLSVYLFLLV